MDPATLNRLEQGKGNPNIKTLEKLAEALGVRVSALLEEEAPKGPRSRGPRFDRFLAEWRGSSEIELVHRNIELAERLIELTDDPAGLPRRLGGKATPGEMKRHVRDLVEAADEAHAVAQALAERAAKKAIQEAVTA
jgi:transcriptional regulator with XRE-family HTH domain